MFAPSFRTILFILALCGLIWSGYELLTYRAYSEATTIGENVASFKDLQDKFTDLAKTKGAPYAYEVLRRAALPPNTDLHLLGHAVGDQLYKQQGVAGIALCTPEFRNACSHSIVIGALQDFGDGALPMIRDACKKAPGGPGAYTMCYHGLGHGVFAFNQYKLAPTVAFCKKTGTPEYRYREYIECVGGAIMELMGGGGHDHEDWLTARKLYLTSPLAPCMSDVIPDEAKGQCLNYLTPGLWTLAGINLGQPDPTLFPKAFGYCAAIPTSKPLLRDQCYGGFGKEFVPLIASRDIRNLSNLSQDQYRTIEGWCHSAGAVDGITSCIMSELSSFYWGGEQDSAISFGFCAALTDSRDREGCYTRLAESINQYTTGDVQKKECSELPETFRTLCLSTKKAYQARSQDVPQAYEK